MASPLLPRCRDRYGGLPFQIYLNIVDIVKVNKWIVWTVITLQLSYPNLMPPLFYN